MPCRRHHLATRRCRFLLFVTKPQLLHGHIMAVSCLGGVVGILAALELKTPPAIINFIYTVTVLLFGILYAYTNHITGITEKAMAKVQTPGGAARGRKLVGPLGDGLLRDVVLNAALFASALVGGFIAGNVGSGSDMLLYVRSAPVGVPALYTCDCRARGGLGVRPRRLR